MIRTRLCSQRAPRDYRTAVEPSCVRRAALVVNIGHTWGPKTDNPQAMPFPHTHWGTKPHKTCISAIPPMGDKDMHFRHSSYGRQRHAFPPFLLWETKTCISAIPPMGDKDMHFRHSSYGRQSLIKVLPLEGFLQSHEQSYIAERTKKRHSIASKH